MDSATDLQMLRAVLATFLLSAFGADRETRRWARIALDRALELARKEIPAGLKPTQKDLKKNAAFFQEALRTYNKKWLEEITGGWNLADYIALGEYLPAHVEDEPKHVFPSRLRTD